MTGAKVQFIPEWAALAGLSQAAVQRALSSSDTSGEGVNKSTVSRWFKGTAVPHPKALVRLAELFGLPEPSSLFRSPDEERYVQFLRRRDSEEIARILVVLYTAFRDERDDVLPEFEEYEAREYLFQSISDRNLKREQLSDHLTEYFHDKLSAKGFSRLQIQDFFKQISDRYNGASDALDRYVEDLLTSNREDSVWSNQSTKHANALEEIPSESQGVKLLQGVVGKRKQLKKMQLKKD